MPGGRGRAAVPAARFAARSGSIVRMHGCTDGWTDVRRVLRSPAECALRRDADAEVPRRTHESCRYALLRDETTSAQDARSPQRLSLHRAFCRVRCADAGEALLRLCA